MWNAYIFLPLELHDSTNQVTFFRSSTYVGNFFFLTAKDCGLQFMRLSLPRLKLMQNMLILRGLPLGRLPELLLKVIKRGSWRATSCRNRNVRTGSCSLEHYRQSALSHLWWLPWEQHRLQQRNFLILLWTLLLGYLVRYIIIPSWRHFVPRCVDFNP